MNTTCKKCGEAKGLTMGVICGNCGESPEKEMKIVFTKQRPTKEGFYWWTNFGEHTPCVLHVTRDYSSGDKGDLYASNGEYEFQIRKPTEEEQQELKLEQEDDDFVEKDGKDTYKYGDELWCYIPPPFLPNETKQVKPDCY